MPEDVIVSPVGAPLVSSGTVEGLDTSTPTSSVTADRFNGLMASYNREQGETARLRDLMARQVVELSELKSQITATSSQVGNELTQTTTQLGAAQAENEILKTQVRTLGAENIRLDFLSKNPDLTAYAALIPTTDDADALGRAAETIRAARQNDQSQMRDQLTTPTRGGSGPARSTNAKMSSKDIDAYLSGTKDTAEFERRLKEVTSQL